jgi:hypothetical protein
MSARLALVAVRAAWLALGKALDIAEGALGDDGDELVSLADGCYGIPGETLARWAREIDPQTAQPRLAAFQVERGRLVAWRSEIRRAIEARPYRPPVKATTEPANDAHDVDDFDPFEAALRDGEIARRK